MILFVLNLYLSDLLKDTLIPSEARRRDGMKINQIKCRPEKVEKRATIVVKINGKIID